MCPLLEEMGADYTRSKEQLYSLSQEKEMDMTQMGELFGEEPSVRDRIPEPVSRN